MGMNILIIDDEELIVRSLVKLLGKHGFKTFVARGCSDALELVEDINFDLIISDVRMPGVSGVEIVKNIYEIWGRRGLAKSPVIFITGYAHEDCERDAETLKPSGYIYKPFDISDLIEKIKEVLM